MNLPFNLFSLVFSSIVVPSLQSAGIRSSTSWPLDTADISLKNSSINYSLLHILFDEDLLPLYKCNNIEADSHWTKNHLISAIGSIGYQLKWPAYIKFFEENRFKLIDDKMNIEIVCQPATITVFPSSSSLQHTQRTSEEDDGGHESGFEITEVKEDTLCNVSTINENTNIELDECTVENMTKQLVIIDSKDISDRRQFIEDIRRREFGLGAELSQEAADLVQRVEGKLSRSLIQLSEELYGLPGHFLLELIQNADDNTYSVDEIPTLEFCLSCVKKTLTESDDNKNLSLLVMNNESVGFSENDMSALCDVGLSTKVTQRDLKIGRKGIGFKSVFNITNMPEVHSNGFHVRFRRQSKIANTSDTQTPSLILVPEWCEENSTVLGNSEVPSWCRTLFVLPLTYGVTGRSIIQSPALQVTQLIQTTLNPSLMLFLRRLQCLTFTSTESNIHWTLKRTINTLSTFMVGKIQCFTQVITVHETQRNLSTSGDKNKIHKWLSFKEIIPVDFKQSSNKNLPSQTEISLAISLTDPEPLQICPIFCYLPVRSVGFRFYINADFDLTSSREDVDSTSSWNHWLVGKISNVFADMIQCIEKLPADCFTSNNDNKMNSSQFNNH
ncbi:unnamed protein product [Heterobilharzia americana]|nr:unnamed protein product [Heterobilharzia americana]